MIPELVSLLILSPLLNAIPITADEIKSKITQLTSKVDLIELTGFSGTYAAILIAVGLLFAFYGCKLFKITLGTTGFVGFGLLALTILESTHLAEKAFGDNRELYSMIIAGVAGLFGAALFLFVWKLGIILLGGFGGFTFANAILAAKPDLAGMIIKHESANLFFISAFVLLFCALTYFQERKLIILSTSLMGSVAILFGVDVFSGTGFSAFVTAFLHAPKEMALNDTAYGYIGAIGALTVLSIFFQAKVSAQGSSLYAKNDE